MNRSLIDGIYRYYKFIKDALFVVDKASEQNIPDLFATTHFIFMTKEEMRKTSCLSQDELNDMVILSLVAAFEREMQCFIADKIECSDENRESGFCDLLNKFIDKKASRWNLEEILGLFTNRVSENILDDLRRVKRYRDLIAHGKQRKLAESSRIPAELVYDTIDQFFIQTLKLDI